MLSPVDGPLTLSPVFGRGSDSLPEPGLVMFTAARCEEVEGSMSSEERNDVLSSSDLVDVMVRKESKRSFWDALGVPLRSRIYNVYPSLAAAAKCVAVAGTFWKFEKDASPMSNV
jgi:hypothetical protein